MKHKQGHMTQKLQPCADCGQPCREIDSPREEHAADCPHWADVTECVRCHAKLVALQARLRLADACAGALRDLAEAQNGPPLVSVDTTSDAASQHIAKWTATMKSSYAALWAYEAVPGDEGSRGMV